jgi:glutaconate CoA-transferase subunit B
MGLLQQGLVDLGFIGGARSTDMATSIPAYVGDWRRPRVRLPGSGGGSDIAALSRRFVVIMPQEKHRFASGWTSSPPGDSGTAELAAARGAARRRPRRV